MPPGRPRDVAEFYLEHPGRRMFIVAQGGRAQSIHAVQASGATDAIVSPARRWSTVNAHGLFSVGCASQPVDGNRQQDDPSLNHLLPKG